MAEIGRGRGDDGVTLPEVTLALALMSVVALAVTGLLMGASRTDSTRTSAAATRLETTIALDRLGREIRQADRVSTPASGSAASVLHLDDAAMAGTWVEWTISNVGLERRSFDGSVTSDWALQAAGIATETAGGPFVTYRGRSGNPLDGAADGLATWSTCTTAVVAVVRMPEVSGDDVLTRLVTIRRRAVLESTC